VTTLAALKTAVLNILYGLENMEHPVEDTLAALLTTGTTSMTPTTTALWKVDDFAEFQDGTDEVVRFAADSAGATAIRRAQLGTADPGTTHASGSVIAKNPPFFRFRIGQMVNEVVRNDLWPHVWTWHKDSITPTATGFMYDLDQYIDEVALVYQGNIDADDRFRPLPPGWWDVERQIDTDFVAQGGLLIINHVYDYDEDVYLIAKRRPHENDLSNVSDAIADMIPYAAAAKAIATRGGQVRHAGVRTAQDKDGGYAREYRSLMSEFLRMRDEHHRLLLDEVREDRRWRGKARAFRRSW
jgi:hypothetical protein